METWFLRSESPPEGQAKYWNNIPPTDMSGVVGISWNGSGAGTFPDSLHIRDYYKRVIPECPCGLILQTCEHILKSCRLYYHHAQTGRLLGTVKGICKLATFTPPANQLQVFCTIIVKNQRIHVLKVIPQQCGHGNVGVHICSEIGWNIQSTI